MAHFAKVENGIVTEIIVSDQAHVDTLEGQWIQTSYNTRNNVHYGDDGKPDGGTPLRGNYAGIGYVYDQAADVFIPPKSYPSWTLNTTSWSWQAPVPYPQDGKDYVWDETNLSWKQIGS